MASGFVVNDTTVASIGTSFALAKKIKMQEDVASDANSLHGTLPHGGARWSHVDLVFANSGAATIDAMICWDSTGDDIAAGPTQNSLNIAAGLTTTGNGMCTLTLDVVPHAPAGQTDDGVVYLFLKVNAGTINLTKARLHWHTFASRP
jgi:hypothetical protein